MVEERIIFPETARQVKLEFVNDCEIRFYSCEKSGENDMASAENHRRLERGRSRHRHG